MLFSQLLKERGADVNRRDGGGHTPLHWACEGSRSDIVLMIIGSKLADVYVADNNGTLPLHLACDRGLPEVVQLMFEK